jgi:nicotinamide mononucleotide transporter
MMSVLEICAVLTSFIGIWCMTKRWLLGWPISFIACLLYFKLFFDVRLYADMMLQALFGFFILIGWYSWFRGKAETGEISVRPLAPRRAIASLAVGAVGAVSVGWIIHSFTDGSLPWMDAALTSFSLVAQYWTIRRHAESWLLWIAVDVVYVAMFVMKELWLTAGLYAAITMLAVIGYRNWQAAKAKRAFE